MRIAALVASALLLLGLAGTASGGARVTPKLTVGATKGLAVVGTGFRPKTFVTVRVAAPVRLRVLRVQAGPRGGFVVRFGELDRCEPLSITARTPSGTIVRVPIVWFTRTCMSGPPLEPGVPPPVD